MYHCAAPAIVACEIIHAVPKSFDIRRIGADDGLLEAHGVGVGPRGIDNGADYRRNAVDLGDAGKTIVSMDENDTIVV